MVDVTLTFSTTWDASLTDTSSQAYLDAVTMATNALITMTGWDSTHFGNLVWTFTQGSVVANADVPVADGATTADVLSILENFDTSTIPNLQSVVAREQVSGKIL